MKVLMLQDTRNYAGTEAHILTLSKALRDCELIDVEFLVPSHGELHKRGSDERFRIYSATGGFFGFLLSAIRAVHVGRPDILHTHNGRTTLIAVLVANVFHCRVVTTQHFLEPAHTVAAGLVGRVKRAVHQWVGRNVDYRICVSHAAYQKMLERDDVIASDSVNYAVIHNGIDIDGYKRTVTKSKSDVYLDLGIDSKSKLVVCAARLELEKNIDILLASFRRVIDSGTKAQLVIAGEGSQRDELERQIIELQLRKCVKMLGFRSDVPDLIAAADAFVLPSSDEPFGLVLVEAMTLGTPIVAAAAGGPLEITDNGKYGFLFEPNNPAMLAERLGLVLGPERRIASEAKSIATERFSARQMASHTKQAYDTVNSISE